MAANCINCSVVFAQKMQTGRLKVYCSRRCEMDARNTRRREQCAATRPNCFVCAAPVPFGQRKYCSRVCLFAVRQTTPFKAKVQAMRDSAPGKQAKRAYHRSDKYKAVCAATRAKRRGAYTEKFDPLDILRRDGWQCQICGVSTPQSRRGTRHHNAPELDHIVPLTKGGAHVPANVQCACHRCNKWKNNRFVVGQRGLFQFGETPSDEASDGN